MSIPKLALTLLASFVVAVACRNGDGPGPAAPGLPGADAGPEQDVDGSVEPVGPVALEPAATDAGTDAAP